MHERRLTVIAVLCVATKFKYEGIVAACSVGLSIKQG